MYSKPVEKLINLFSRFPGVGPKTSARFVFYLLNKNSKKEVEELGKAILDLPSSLKKCSFCFKFFEGDGKLCPICSDPRRDKTTLCVVEKETDLASIEKNHVYNGLYFILGGTVSDLDKESIKKLRIKELFRRMKEPQKFGIKTQFKEVILGLNPTLEGDATARLLKRKLKDPEIKTTRLGRGLPQGGELEYADRETLSFSFENRG